VRRFFIVGLLAFCIIVSGVLAILVEGLNPDPDNARYILSAMAQVIGTVFVLSVAVMQMISSSKKIRVNELIKSREFWFTAVAAAAGILLPLFILYSGCFCITTIICLGIAVWVLMVIGWFIYRMLLSQGRIAELRQLRDDAKENLDRAYQTLQEQHEVQYTNLAVQEKKNIFSARLEEAKELLGKAKGIALKKGEEDITQEAAEAIHSAAISIRGIRGFDAIWKYAIESLVKLDEVSYKKALKDLNLKITSYLVSFVVRYARTGADDWELIRKHFFEYFREALLVKRIKLERAKSHTEIDYLSAMCSLLVSASAPAITAMRGTYKSDIGIWMERWEEVQAKIINEFTETIKDKKLRRHYQPERVFALLFHIITDWIYIFHIYRDEKVDIPKKFEQLIGGFAKAATGKGDIKEAICELWSKAKTDIESLKYKVKSTKWVIDNNKEKFQRDWIKYLVGIFDNASG